MWMKTSPIGFSQVGLLGDMAVLTRCGLTGESVCLGAEFGISEA